MGSNIIMAKKKKNKDKNKNNASSNYKNSSAYKALSSDGKKQADLYYEVSSGSSKYTTSQLKDALKLAKKDSSGYMKQVLTEFETGVSQQLAIETGDWQSHIDTVNENIKEINDNLNANIANLTLEEQQLLAKQARDYEQQAGQLVDKIAGTGMTFSTIGEQQKKYAEETNKGIVESTTAQFDANIERLNREASQGRTQAQQQLKDYNRQHAQNISSLGLKAETYLGTDKLGETGLIAAGYAPMTGISGQYKEDSVKDIQERQKSYLDNNKQSSLNF